MVDKKYDASNIQVLEGLSPVRLRPGMYLGDSGKRGMHHCVAEILDNSIDEAMAGHCDKIDVVLEEDGETISIEDNGRGIPVDLHPEKKISALEIVFTVLHAGGKFDGSGYEASGGLHGVGASCVNAVSDYLFVEVHRDGGLYTQSYSCGIPKTKVERVRDLTSREKKHGTKVTFHPDATIFKESIKFDENLIVKKLREMSFLNKGLTINFTNKKTKTTEKFLAEGGISDYVKYLTEARTGHYPTTPIYAEVTVPLGTRPGNALVQIALNYTVEDDETILTFANNINTNDGGTHLSGFKTALTRIVNKFAKSLGSLKEKETGYSGDEIREGLTAIISVRLPQPEFVGQTKNKLGSVEMEGIVASTVADLLNDYFDKNAAIIKKIVERAEIAREARDAARKATNLIKRKSFLGNSSRLPGKLSDCNSNKREECELFLVEGDSAGGCFSGDTKVALADGRNLTFLELLDEQRNGIENYCYSILEDKIEIQKIADCFFTKRDKFCEVYLDNGEIIKCTYDHLFMLRDGSYCKAKDLEKNTSLMPFYRRISKKGENKATISGYDMIYCPNRRMYIFSHMLSDNYNVRNEVYSIETGNCRHHIDFNKNNNNPTNIIRMDKIAHLKLHQDIAHLVLHTKENKEKSTAAKRTPEFRAKMSKIIKNSSKAKIASKKLSESIIANEEKRNNLRDVFLEKYRTDEDFKRDVDARLSKQQKEYWNVEENRNLASERTKKLMTEDRKKELSSIAKEQWKDSNLIEWRKSKTSEQWTEDFRIKRKVVLDKRQYNSCILELQRYVKNKVGHKDSAKYQKFNRFCNKFFGGNRIDAELAIKNKLEFTENLSLNNHKVAKVKLHEEIIDFYDIEVSGSHNFALTQGVFVHNSSKSGRDSETQAILPLRGKVINAEKNDMTSLLANKEIQSMILAIGAGFKDDFDIEKRRYDKVILMCDADTDGAHICSLLMVFFYRYMKDLITKGHLYLAQPPLYRVDYSGKKNYCYSDKELTEELTKAGGKGKVTRFKGLGEMNASELAETTMDKTNRKLIQLKISDFGEAERLLSTLMGNNAQLRKDHIIGQVNGIINTGA